MLEVGFRDLKTSAKDIRDKQVYRSPFFMGASIPVSSASSGRISLSRATLVCDRDADILITGLSATVIAPADIKGRRILTQASSFPIKTGQTGYAERGLKLRIFASSDKEDQLSFPENFMDAKDFLQPGYMPGRFSRPYPFTRYLTKDSKLTFEFLNTDEAEGDFYHYVSLVLTCKKYLTGAR